MPRKPFVPAEEPPPDRAYGPRPAGPGGGTLCHCLPRNSAGFSPDDRLLKIHRRLLLRLKERRHHARRSATQGAAKAEDRDNDALRERKDISEKPAVPVQHNGFCAARAHTWSIRFGNAVGAELNIPLYIQAPIHYDKNGDSFAGANRKTRPPNLIRLPICVSCEIAPS